VAARVIPSREAAGRYATNPQKVALLFPGQRADYPGVPGQAARPFPFIANVWSEIDAIAGKRLKRRVSDAIWSSRLEIDGLEFGRRAPRAVIDDATTAAP